MLDVIRRLEAASVAPGLGLTPLTPQDVDAYLSVRERNRDHLLDGSPATLDADRAGLVGEFAGDAAPGGRFGIRLHGELIGRVDLVAVDPPRFGLGYWVDAGSGGRGLATAACARAVLLAAERGATDVFAGVTKGNVRSAALLTRLGFHAVQDLGDYTRFRLRLRDE